MLKYGITSILVLGYFSLLYQLYLYFRGNVIELLESANVDGASLDLPVKEVGKNSAYLFGYLCSHFFLFSDVSLGKYFVS